MALQAAEFEPADEARDAEAILQLPDSVNAGSRLAEQRRVGRGGFVGYRAHAIA